MFQKVAIVVIFCFTVNYSTAANDAGELLSQKNSPNFTQPRRVIKFENNLNSNYVSFEDENYSLSDARPFKFDIDHELNIPSKDFNDDGGSTNIKFDNFAQDIDENALNNSLSNGFRLQNEKKKRRRRKPRQQFHGQPGFPNLGYPGPIRPPPNVGQGYGFFPGPGQNIGFAPVPDQNFGPNRPQPEFNGQFYRPPRFPQPSLASDALSAVTGALTSIAQNDDYQCVPRLLCEAAAGGALGGSSLLESISGLQPLLTLLSAYNGISSNPLFVFGRAAFLGMSSKSNPGSCRYAYPLCPNDPEELVHYLNNHNGGFFRFFNAPQHGQQNLEQFYNQLSQNPGPYRPSPGNNQEYYGLLNPGPPQNFAGQPNPYINGYQENYGSAYPYNQHFNNENGIRFKNEKEINNVEIEKRIQNKPASFLNDNSIITNSKWLFPGDDDDDRDESTVGVQYVNSDDFKFIDHKKGKVLRFPGANSGNDNGDIKQYDEKDINFYNKDIIRQAKGISFPENQSNLNYYDNKYYRPGYSNEINYLHNNFDKGVNEFFKGSHFNHNSYNDYNDEPGVTTVYVVRGNGDPSKPEIVRLRAGETLNVN